MQTIEISKRQIKYHHEITLTYKIKITRTIYTNKKTNKKYKRYKIRIPQELTKILQHQNKIYYNKKAHHIQLTTHQTPETIHTSKIQKNTYNKKTEYTLTLPKKLFNLQKYKHLEWIVKLENNKIKDSIIIPK